MKLMIEIELPDRAEVLASGCPVPIARKGVKWSASCLGEMAKQKGVYVIHHAGEILYVGKTEAPTMDFGTRLRREFQETAAAGKHIYPKLCVLAVPPKLTAHFYAVKEIQRRIKSNETYRIDEIIALFEIVMINHLHPEYQQHAVNSVYKYVTKVMGTAIAQSITPEEIKKFMEEKAQAKIKS